MIKTSNFGIVVVEKIIGISLLAIGFILTYYTYSNQSIAGLAFPYFALAGVILVIIGVLLLVAKVE